MFVKPSESHLVLNDLNQAQRQAVLHTSGPVLVLAGAGSGKTRVVTRRIAHLLSQGIAHHQIIALTFTNKAAGEMRERLLHMVSLSPWVGTFHSFGLRILREWSPLIGLNSNFVIYDPGDCEKVLKQVLQEAGMKLSASSLANYISLCKNKAQSPDEVCELPVHDSEQLELEQLRQLYRRYEQAMQTYNAVDFDDLLFLCVKLLREHPQALQELQNRWRYLLVDEYQDTNLCQYEMIRLLAGSQPELFVVGDPDQSIYSWRGADISNILNFERDFPGAKVICLEENYRSSPQILAAASELIANNQQRYKKVLRSTQSDSDPITLYCAPDDRAEAGFVAREIERLVEAGCDFHDIAVFYRTNFQSRAIEDALRRQSLPYIISGGVSFYQRKEIKDILAYVRLILFDYDRIAFERALGAPKRGLGEKTLEKLFTNSQEKQLSPLEFMANPENLQRAGITAKARSTLHQFYCLIQEFRQNLSQQTISECLKSIIERTDYMRYLSEQEDNSIERMENINELIAKAMEWQDSNFTLDQVKTPVFADGIREEARGVNALRAFVEEMNLGPQEAASDANSEAITLMTVHNAKGLEFNNAFIVGLEEMLFPHIYHKTDEKQLEEERRLLYVGMTRARRRLYLSYAQSRFLWGTTKTMRPSRFIYELPTHQMKLLGLSRLFF